MIHRDVKPGNILLTKRGQAVLTDFGIAQIVGGTRYTVSGALMGTLNYMAPEQGLEGQCDVRSDLYSLGIVLYEMLIGDPPFDAETPLAILMKHVNDPLPLPRQVNPAIPQPLERVVLKALSKRREARYQSAEEMAQALRKAAEDAGIELPSRVSQPLSFTTLEAPSESVVVLSGTAREKVRDVEFSTEDTEMRLSERLAAELAVGQGAASVAQEMDRDPARVEPAVRQTSVKVAETKRPRAAAKRGQVGKAIINAIGILVIGNLVAVFIGLITGWWGVFGRGWPFELLLVGWGLCLIMEASGSVWFLIPTGIILGNGLLMAFYAITNAWELWAFLWPLEPLLIVGVVLVAIWLSRQGNEGRRVVSELGRLSKRLAIVVTPIVMVMGAIFG
jgi:hypothetical protein